MIRYANILIFISLILAFLSCVKEIDSNAEFESKLYVNSIISPDTTISVSVLHTAPVFGDRPTEYFVEEAEVTIYDRTIGERIELFHTSEGIYKCGVNAKPGHSYELQVSAPGFESVYSAIAVPILDNFDFFNFSIEQDEDIASLHVEVEIDASFGTDKFYAWDVSVKTRETSPEPVEEGVAPTADVAIADEFTSLKHGFTPTRSLVPVEQYDLADGKFTAIINNAILNDSEESSIESFLESNKITIRVVAVSKSYYEYLFDSKNAESNSSSITVPEDPYSNIINGYGIFASYNERYKSL